SRPALQLTYHAKPEPRIGDVHRCRRAPGRPRLRGRTRPGAAADHLVAAAWIDPGRAVAGCTAVTIMPAVGDPFADVAGQVVKAPCIGFHAAHRRGPPVAVAVAGERVGPGAPGRRAVQPAGGVGHPRRRFAFAPGEAPAAAGAQRVLELGFAGQAVALAGL